MGFITANPTIDMLSDQQPSIYYLDDGTAVFKCITSPEGVITANAGSLALQNNGSAFIKTTDGGNTGWISVGNSTQFASASSAISTSGTGLDNLQSIVTPVNIISQAGQGFKIYTEGQEVGVAGNHRWVINFDGTPVFDTGLIAAGAANAGWIIECTFGLQNGGVQADMWNEFQIFNNATGVLITTLSNIFFSIGWNPAITHTILFQGECSNGADAISQRITMACRI